MINGDVDVAEIMKVLNKSDLLKSEKDTADLKVLNSLVAVLGKDPLVKANGLIVEVKENAEAVKEASLVTAFGAVKNADGTDNLVRIQGELLLGDKVANADNVKAVKENASFIAVCGNLADENSELNKIKTNSDDTLKSGIKHVKA